MYTFVYKKVQLIKGKYNTISRKEAHEGFALVVVSGVSMYLEYEFYIKML
jgi:hypothetical protein